MPTKAVRFSEKENEAIKKFLNPHFDFSTIARIAILRLIENPQINLKPSKVHNKKDKTSNLELQ